MIFQRAGTWREQVSVHMRNRKSEKGEESLWNLLKNVNLN